MMYSPSKEERIIRILKSGRNYIHINKEEGGREGVEKTVSIQTRWLVYHTRHHCLLLVN